MSPAAAPLKASPEILVVASPEAEAVAIKAPAAKKKPAEKKKPKKETKKSKKEEKKDKNEIEVVEEEEYQDVVKPITFEGKKYLQSKVALLELALKLQC